MNQQINLYLPEFVVQKDPFTAVLMGQILAAAVVLMLLVSAWDLVGRWRLGSELEALQATLAEETRKTAALEAQVAQRSQDLRLLAQLEAAEARYASALQIRDFLSDTKLGNMDGFSEYFKDLSRAAVEGLSLSEFEFSEGGEQISMAGQVLNSAIVPRYVNSLENGQSSMRAKTFSPSIVRSDADALLFDFELSTTHE